MSLFRRTLLLGALALAGCGFTPIHGPGGNALSGQIEVAAPEDRDGFAFVSRMEERLGRANGAPYVLAYTITTAEDGLAITGSNDITRFNVTGEIAYTVTALGADTPTTSGKVNSFTSYSASGSTISTLTSERDARARLMEILADQIVTRLMVDPALQ